MMREVSEVYPNKAQRNNFTAISSDKRKTQTLQPLAEPITIGKRKMTKERQ